MAVEQAEEEAVLLRGFYELGLAGGWDFVGFNESLDELFDFENLEGVVNSQGVVGIDRDLQLLAFDFIEVRIPHGAKESVGVVVRASDQGV